MKYENLTDFTDLHNQPLNDDTKLGDTLQGREAGTTPFMCTAWDACKDSETGTYEVD